MGKRNSFGQGSRANVGGIDRRDFLNGMLIGLGGVALQGIFPTSRALADSSCGASGTACAGSLASDPRALRGGNLPSVFNVGHWLRDNRLTFGSSSVTVAPSSCDTVSGSFPINADPGTYDVIIVGSGISGLSAAYYLTRERPGLRILILDGNQLFGGNAGRDDEDPIPVISGTAGAYAVVPYADFLVDIYSDTGIEWEKHIVADPFYNYFFDEQTPYVNPGTRGWSRDVYGAGLKDMPYAPEIIQDLQKAKQDFRNWYARHGSPTDPADNSDPKYDYLAQMTLDDYFTSQKYHPAVSDFYTRYSIDALAGTTKQVNAYNSISFLGAEYNPIFSLPGGTSGIARHFLNWLIPGAIDGTTTEEIIANPINDDRLDQASNPVRVRQCAMVLRGDTGSSSASVIYFHEGQFSRATAKAVIFAGQSHTANRAVDHLIDQTTRDAWDQFTMVPVITANVTLRSAAPLVNLGLGYNQYWWGSKYWADFVVADWVAENRGDPDRETVLSFYGGNWAPPEDMKKERGSLIRTAFSSYEASLREDLNRILASEGFDFDRDVSGVYLYRWGHGMIYPKPGFPFGVPQNKNGQVIRTPAPRHIARQQVGRISFAGQDTESSPAIESAIGSGYRTAAEVLAYI